MRSELDRIVNVTEYNGQKLVDGSISGYTALDFQVGMNNSANDRISMSLANTSTGLGIDTDSLHQVLPEHKQRSLRSILHLRQLTPSVRRLVRPEPVADDYQQPR